MRSEFKYITALSMLFVFAFIVAEGLWLPWSEEGVLYALYGGSVGFFAAIAMSMFVVWSMRKRR
jgi:hypothetical protein